MQTFIVDISSPIPPKFLCVVNETIVLRIEDFPHCTIFKKMLLPHSRCEISTMDTDNSCPKTDISEETIEENNNDEPDEQTSPSKVNKFRVTIEPALFLGLTSLFVVYLTFQNLLLGMVLHKMSVK